MSFSAPGHAPTPALAPRKRAHRHTRRALCLLAAIIPLAGCRSPFIQASIVNNTGAALATVELDYPGASFGVSTLAPHATYTYRFKLLGSGPLTLTYTEPPGTPRTVHGPELREGQQGTLTIQVEPRGAVTWQPRLTPGRSAIAYRTTD